MTDKHKETCAVVRDEKDDRLLPHQIRRPRQTKGRKILKRHQVTEENSSDKRSEIPCRYILLCVKTTSLKKVHTWKEVFLFRHVEAEEKPNKKWKTCGAKGSVAMLKESTQLGCASQNSHPRKSILGKRGKLGSNHAVKFSKGTWHQIKVRERKGPSGGIIHKCAHHERGPCAPKFEER